MKKQEIADLACAELEKLYPGAQCTLDYGEPYQLMMATRLAAQCTDARVNVVTKTLFKKYPTLQAFADADLAELEQDVKPCGFCHRTVQFGRDICRARSPKCGECPLNYFCRYYAQNK